MVDVDENYDHAKDGDVVDHDHDHDHDDDDDDDDDDDPDILMILTDPYALASASLFSSHNTWYIILHWPFLHFYRGGVLERCCRGELSGTLAMRHEMT